MPDDTTWKFGSDASVGDLIKTRSGWWPVIEVCHRDDEYCVKIRQDGMTRVMSADIAYLVRNKPDSKRIIMEIIGDASDEIQAKKPTLDFLFRDHNDALAFAHLVSDRVVAYFGLDAS